MNIKNSNSYTFLKCGVHFFIVLNLILTLLLTSYAIYLFVLRQEKYFESSKLIVYYYLSFPIILALFASISGWCSMSKKNVKGLKFVAVLLSMGVIVEIGGSLWCFVSIPKIKNEVTSFSEHSFHSLINKNPETESWWSGNQRRLKCCGINGPNDYKTKKAVPFSCCGTDPYDATKASCSFIFQKGCSHALVDEVSYDIIYLALGSLGVALIQIPAVFISWYYGKKIKKDGSTPVS